MRATVYSTDSDVTVYVRSARSALHEPAQRFAITVVIPILTGILIGLVVSL